MSSLTSALRIGISGMQTSQMALSTVSHNVVNANTVGYSRQNLISSAASTNGYGAGVQLETIQRVTDKFAVGRVLTATSDASYASSQLSYLQSLENTFTSSSVGGGLESVVGNFITSMNNLSTDPSNSSLRRSAVQQATVTANALNNTSQDLSIVATDADNEITAQLAVVNQLLKDIHTLNTEIAQLQTGSNGSNANDLMDSRAQMVNKLSETFGLQVTENTTNGALRITTESGRKLVDESSYVQLSRGVSGGTYQSIVARNVLQDGSLSNTQLPIATSELTTGRVKALADIRDNVVPSLLAQVDEFTRTFTSTVNSLASAGTSSPPVRTLSSGSTADIASTTTGFTNLNGTSINITVTNSLGNTVTTTSPGGTPAGTPITFNPVAPATTLSLQDIADQINNNTTIGNAALQLATPGSTQGVIATATTDASGNPILTITSADPNNKIVLSNVTGNALGFLGMNNIFSNGNTAGTVAVRSELAANPDLFPVARMRADGGVSSTDGSNIQQLAALADTKLTFASAGGLGTQIATGVSYLNTVISNLAVRVSSAEDTDTFNTNLKSQAEQLATSVSGVNINEELAQMLVYQNSFQASSRIISVVNDLLQELVNIV